MMSMIHLCMVMQLEIRPGEYVEKPPVPPPVLLALVSDNLMEVMRCSVGDLFVS
jgi:hypothetical protein